MDKTGTRAGLLALALLCAPALLRAAPDEADFTRSITLRERWQYLTREVAWPAHWSVDGSRFAYRKTVEGGFAFEAVTAKTLAKSAAFDQPRLAAALGTTLGHPIDPLRLPFDAFDYIDDDRAIRFRIGEQAWRCDLGDYRCAVVPDHDRPRGFGVVRDLSVPAANDPQRSPDGRWEAFVRDDNLVLRRPGTIATIPLSSDGSAGHFYDPETLLAP